MSEPTFETLDDYQNQTRALLAMEKKTRATVEKEFGYKLRQARIEGYEDAKRDYRKTKARWTRALQIAVALAGAAVGIFLVSLIPGCVSYMDVTGQAEREWYTNCITQGGSVWERPDSSTDYCVIGKVVSTR